MKLEVGKRYHIKPTGLQTSGLYPNLPEGTYIICHVDDTYFSVENCPCGKFRGHWHNIELYSFTPLDFAPGDLVDVITIHDEPSALNPYKIIYCDNEGYLLEDNASFRTWWHKHNIKELRPHTAPQLEIGQVYKIARTDNNKHWHIGICDSTSFIFARFLCGWNDPEEFKYADYTFTKLVEAK